MTDDGLRLAPSARPAPDGGNPNAARPVPSYQPTFDDLGTPLRDVTFVVVDLETTGTNPSLDGITEIGAVKVRAGEVVGEFQTLVHPGVPMPPFIAVLTGITDTMLVGAPPVSAVLPAFLEFAHGAVLVAHNAPFDTGFLKNACMRLGHTWPSPPVVDTARLARGALSRDEVPNCKLGTLARFFRSGTEPVHRALEDARATVDVLHGILARLGGVGVQTLEDLVSFTGRVSDAQRRKKHLADSLPQGPGVYVFRDDQKRPLYVGTSRAVRTRVRSYFTAGEQRARMAEMVGLASEVTAVPCATALEAQVRELRLIAEHRPRYNRRSKFPERLSWLKLTVEPFPRLSVVREVRDDAAGGAAYIGPFGGRRAAELAAEAILEAVPLRTCRTKLSTRGSGSACALAEMGRCGAPCEGAQKADDYAPLADLVRTAMHHDVRPVAEAVLARLDLLVADERFEQAAAWRDRLAAFVRGAARSQRLTSLVALDELVAARPTADHGWEVHVVRRGRLVAAATVAPGLDPRPHVDAAVAAAEQLVHVPPAPMPAAGVEEAECVLRWLEQPGVRLVATSAPWSSPAYGADRLRDTLAAARESRAYDGERRALRPVAQPAALLASRIRLDPPAVGRAH